MTWTRIFSAEFFYTFAFLVLSLAVLGLGLGALALRLWRCLNRETMLGLNETRYPSDTTAPRQPTNSLREGQTESKPPSIDADQPPDHL